jgi:hypothetical protein
MDGNPMKAIWEEHQGALSEDFRLRRLREGHSATPDAILNDALCELQEVLGGLGSSLRNIGLPDPVARHREVEEEIALWKADPYDLQSFESSLTSDQVSLMALLHLLS